MIVCITEDRASFEIPIKILLLSLAKHCSTLHVKLFYPPANDAFVAWIKNFPQIDLETTALPSGRGWNIKPQALLTLLEAGHDDVVWIDSDIIVTRDFHREFASLGDDVLLATEEALWGNYSDADARRGRLWGMPIGRQLPFTVNTGVLRVTRSHIPLLAEWQKLLESDAYQSAQLQAPDHRPFHMFGDQDVLTALLTSKDFCNVDIKFIKRGSGIIQYFGLSGYTCAERLYNLVYGPPQFVHSQTFKPWVKFIAPRDVENVRDYADSLYLDLSPYTLAAMKYLPELSTPCDWMRPQSRIAAFMRAIGFWYAPLVGLPMAAMADIVRIANLRFMKRFYFRRDSLRDSVTKQTVSDPAH